MVTASIRVRLTAWFVGVLMVSVVGMGVAVYMLLGRSLLERVDAMLDFEFEEAKERLEAGQPAGELAAAPAAFHEAYLLRILGPGGAIVAQSPGLAGRPIPVPSLGPIGRASGHLSDDLGALGPYRVVAGVIGSGSGRHVILIATSLETYEAELEELRRALWTILPAGLLAATIGGYWLAGRSLAPVQRMTDAVRRISAENINDRLTLANTTDELGRLGAMLNAMLDRLDRSFAATRRFTADAAHELKTPVATIRAEAEVALISRRRPEDYEETLRSIVEETDRLSRLADRLLLLSREDSGVAIPRRPIRLDEAVRSAVADAIGAASRAGVELRVGDMPRLEIEGDPDLIRQVFDNLIDNAVKYTPAGGEVVVSGRRVDGRGIVEVSDTGIGIPGDALPRIFDRFYRVDPSRSRHTGGTGLGLSIARIVVERHGGAIEVSSASSSGSTFRVSLPLNLGNYS